MANFMYNTAKAKLGDGTIDWDTSVIKVLLLDATGAAAADPDDTSIAVIDTNEVTGTGYTAGGATMTCSAPTVDTVNDWAEYDATDVTWSTSTITASGAVVYSGDVPICFVDFGASKVSSAGDFTIQWHADGVFKLA